MGDAPADPTAAGPGRSLRLTVGPEPVAVVLVGLAVGVLAFGMATAARRYLGWAVASAVVASLLEPLVRWLGRVLPRLLAVVAAFLLLGGVVFGVGFGVLRDLGTQIDRLQEVAPDAAAELERSDRFGEVARDLRLAERVTDAVERLQDPTSGVASQVASSAGTWFLCLILTLSLLSALPRMGRGALEQIADPHRRERARSAVLGGFARGRGYIVGTLGLAAASGALGWGLCRAEGVPAPLALGVTMAAGSIVPGVGIVLGGLPALLLEAGLGTPAGAGRLFVALLLLQALHTVAVRRLLAPRTLVVGPATIVLALVLGFEVYGVGGAAYAAALATIGVAVLDAAGEVFERPASAASLATGGVADAPAGLAAAEVSPPPGAPA